MMTLIGFSRLSAPLSLRSIAHKRRKRDQISAAADLVNGGQHPVKWTVTAAAKVCGVSLGSVHNELRRRREQASHRAAFQQRNAAALAQIIQAQA
jgi:hypothetical protein